MFFSYNRCEILKKLFSKIIIPSPVYYELIRIEKYENLKDELNSLINEGFVEIQEFDFASPEETNFNLIHRAIEQMVILLVGENPLQWHLQLK